MTERYEQYSSSAKVFALLVPLIGLAAALVQWSEYMRTGRTIVGYSSNSGWEYGLTIYLIVPFLQMAVGLAFIYFAFSGRIEVDDHSIAALDPWGNRSQTIEWPDVIALRRVAQSVHGERSQLGKTYLYEVEGHSGKVSFLESMTNSDRLVATIRQRMPADAIDDLKTF